MFKASPTGRATLGFETFEVFVGRGTPEGERRGRAPNIAATPPAQSVRCPPAGFTVVYAVRPEPSIRYYVVGTAIRASPSLGGGGGGGGERGGKGEGREGGDKEADGRRDRQHRRRRSKEKKEGEEREEEGRRNEFRVDDVEADLWTRIFSKKISTSQLGFIPIFVVISVKVELGGAKELKGYAISRKKKAPLSRGAPIIINPGSGWKSGGRSAPTRSGRAGESQAR